MTKAVQHIRFRNNELFCAHCGSSQAIPFPIAVSRLTAMADAWEEMHLDCEPVWKEPKPDMASSEDERIFFWMSHGEHGQSSKYMAWKLQNSRTHPYAEPARPYDPSDFGRCHKLLAMVPEFRARMDRLKECGPEWAALVDHWDELTAMYEAKDQGMCDRINQLTEPDPKP